MKQENSYKFALLPVYLVLDTSASMSENGALEAAMIFVSQMIYTLERQPSVADKIRVEVIRFAGEAEVLLPLGEISALDEWWEQNGTSAFRANGEPSCYGAAFRLLRSRIEIGAKQIRTEDADESGQKLEVYRPLVFLIMDGEPLDNPADREWAFSELTGARFRDRPNIVCVGVGDATVEDLKLYSAGKSDFRDDEYETGKSSLVFVSKDGMVPEAAIVKPFCSLYM